MTDLSNLIKKQQTYFANGNTLDYAFRKKQLEKLRGMLKKYENDIYYALKQDLNKSRNETFLTEIGFLYTEINFALSNLKEWMQPDKVDTPITHKGTESFIYKDPYGVSLIIAPWNYPLQLSIAPAIGSIAAGNCVVLKPSEYAKATSILLMNMISATFDNAYFAVVEGAEDVSKSLLKQKFDYIFFTGSTAVGKIVMQEASNNLTPITLELGGKSPVIIDKDANIKLAAKRIVWGKFTNAGQTCVAPDFLYVHAKVKKRLVKAMINYIEKFYEKNPIENNEYVHIINDKHFTRLKNFLTDGNILHGGRVHSQKRAIEPTIIENISWEDPIMQDEIFGPLLPIFTFDKLDNALTQIKQLDKPLSFYYFGENKKTQEMILKHLPFGGGCINDTIFHLANPHLPFGGVGNSGQGAYHGKYSFETFSHKKSVLKQTTKMDLPFRYPNGKVTQALLRRIMK